LLKSATIGGRGEGWDTTMENNLEEIVEKGILE
jgi:hypothetical protein